MVDVQVSCTNDKHCTLAEQVDLRSFYQHKLGSVCWPHGPEVQESHDAAGMSNTLQILFYRLSVSIVHVACLQVLSWVPAKLSLCLPLTVHIVVFQLFSFTMYISDDRL